MMSPPQPQIIQHMNLQFKKNRHYPTLKSLFFSLTLPRKKTVKVKFTHEAKYIHGNVDQFDWNKLYGCGNIWRFGALRKEEFYAWRYLPTLDRFEVTKYTREGGHFYWGEITKLETNQKIELQNHWFTLPIPLPTYFGGNRKTPNEIIIECQ